jgi:hypothetical protein
MHVTHPWRLVALGAALFALVGLPALWTSAWASDSGKALSYQSDQSDDDDDREPYLEERVAALETQVAELQTAVAELQADDDEGLADEAEPTPTIAVPPAAACGRPFANWGTATSDNVSVHLIQVVDGAEADFAVEGAQVYAVELELLNSRDDVLDIDPEDFVVTDCDGAEYTALDRGVDPPIAGGKVAPGDEAQGWATFALPPGGQPVSFDYRIQSPGRSGAEVSCPLVDTSAEPATLDDAAGGAGCSARGGSAG